MKGSRTISDTQGYLTAFLPDFSSLGTSVAALGDLDGDGVGDLGVGATGDNDYRGAVYILLLTGGSVVRETRVISSSQGGLRAPLASEDFFGSAIAVVGNMSGGGGAGGGLILAVGASGDTRAGAVYILLLSPGRLVFLLIYLHV